MSTADAPRLVVVDVEQLRQVIREELELALRSVAAPAPAEELWDAADVARVLKLSPSWVYEQANAGALPSIRIGTTVRFEPAAVRAWIAGEQGGKIVKLPGLKKVR